MSATLAAISRPAFVRLLGAWRAAIARHFVRRAAVASLRELDDHVLRDIGLERSQIKAAACGRVALSGQGRMQ